MTFKEMNKNNTSFEDFKEACLERAKQEPDIEYANEAISDTNALKWYYDHNTSVDSTVYLMAY